LAFGIWCKLPEVPVATVDRLIDKEVVVSRIWSFGRYHKERHQVWVVREKLVEVLNNATDERTHIDAAFERSTW